MTYTLRTTSFDEPVVLSDVAKFYQSDYSIEPVTVVSGAGVLDIGTVLGKITASGKYKAAAADAVDGSQTAVAVLAEKIDASAADKTALALVRFAIVSRAGLKWHANTDTTNERAAAVAQLAAVGIITREGA